MNKNQIRQIALIGIVFVVFSVIAFLVPFVKNAVFWVTYVFSTIAILAQYYVLNEAFNKGENVKSKFYGFPIANIGIVYLILQIVVGLLFMALAKWIPLWIPTVLYVIGLGAALFGFISADVMREEIERQDEKLKVDVVLMRRLQSESKFLISQCNNADTKKAVETLAEKLRYSDPVSKEELREVENDLSDCMSQLQTAVIDNDDLSAVELSKKAIAILEKRNHLCKLSK